MKKTLFLFIAVMMLCFQGTLNAQLKIGSAQSEINFREGPGQNYKVLHTINSSNLLVVLPREPQNGFIEAFDVETSSRGFVYESLIRITDTLAYQHQKFFAKSDDLTRGDIEINITNRTNHPLFVWINQHSYDLDPFEKKVLVLDTGEVIYFSSAPGLFPVFGREILQRGSAYDWNFSL